MLDVEFLKQNGVDVEKSLELFGDMETYNDTVGDFLIGLDSKLPLLKKYKDRTNLRK